MKSIGRIIARGNNIAGIFLPFKTGEGLDGIYEVREVLGELELVRIGDPAMPETRFKALDLDGLMADRPYCGMTREEIGSVTDDPNRNLWHPQLS